MLHVDGSNHHLFLAYSSLAEEMGLNSEQEINYGEKDTPGVKCDSDFKTKRIG